MFLMPVGSLPVVVNFYITIVAIPTFEMYFYPLKQ